MQVPRSRPTLPILILPRAVQPPLPSTHRERVIERGPDITNGSTVRKSYNRSGRRIDREARRVVPPGDRSSELSELARTEGEDGAGAEEDGGVVGSPRYTVDAVGGGVRGGRGRGGEEYPLGECAAVLPWTGAVSEVGDDAVSAALDEGSAAPGVEVIVGGYG